MTAIQQRFVQEYTVDGIGAAAAVRAGYSKKTAKQKAYELLQNEEIVNAIKERWVSLAMTAEEATKRLSDIAATRLNDYITVEEVWDTPMIKKHLSVLIAELQLELDIEEEVADRTGLFDGNGETSKKDKKLTEAQDEFFLEQAKRKRQIVRYEVELEKNPMAYRFVKGEPILIKKPSVNLIELAKAQERGNIKKISFNERGLPSVEGYAADNAMQTILKLNGKLIDRQDHTTKGESLNKGFLDFLKKVNRA
ncbi:terminase small subunit [Spirosoma pollinicola]|uniref:Terminase small subunit n=1 Tax=Spirosoma pollinicola TaxID=2057025 RepID=A0A2K8YTK3_9BACT|nr:terminase small subunit [Spirosoma pollinicola]AUD00951.1 hypothetical protein CWM47_03435 [Spirosoma pollinicola]